METRRAIRSNGVVVGWELYSGGVPATHLTTFKASQFLEDLVTDTEFDLMVDSNNPDIKKIVRRFEIRNKNINVADQQYIDFMALGLSLGIIADQARHDDLLLGIPI